MLGLSRRFPFLLLGQIFFFTGCSTDSETGGAEGQEAAASGSASGSIGDASGGAGLEGTAGSGGGDGTDVEPGVGGSGSDAGSGDGGSGDGSGAAGGLSDGGSSDSGSAAGGSSDGGSAAGGSSDGGSAAGGSGSGGDGSGGSGDGASDLAAQYPCDGSTEGYDAVVSGSEGSWTVSDASGQQTWSGESMMTALFEGLGVLDQSRTSKESVLVLGDGTVSASERLSVPSYIVLNVCGTIHVEGTPGSDMSPFYVRGKTDVDIPHARVTGTPAYGMFFRETSNIHLGHIELDLELDSWLGIRVDNKPSWPDFPPLVKNLTIDYVKVTSSGSHGVETYGVDGIKIGEFVGESTGGCGLILNHSVNAEVGSVTCDDCAYIDTGYAAFRVANDNGKIGEAWPAGNVHVGSVYARGGGRGIFSVSGSGGLTIDKIDIKDTGNNAILLQNAYNTTIAADAGTVSNGSVILSNDTDNTNDGTFEPSSNVILQNLTLSDGASVSEAWCELGDRGNQALNITGGSVDMCF